jgi:hypothetical protein
MQVLANEDRLTCPNEKKKCWFHSYHPNILSRVSVTKEGVRIGNWIY